MGSTARSAKEPPAPDLAGGTKTSPEEVTATADDNSSGVEMATRTSDHPAHNPVLAGPRMEVEPAQGTALFSTGFGRRPKRVLQEPLGPVIVHTPKYDQQHVVSLALHLKGYYPFDYMRFLPDSNWTIEDLFDDVEIHLQGRSILKEVLRFICYDNVAHMRHFVKQWSLVGPERMERVGNLKYDHENPYGVVVDLFREGETMHYPPEFLWHAANFMRQCYNTCAGLLISKGTGDEKVHPEMQKSPKGDDSLGTSTRSGAATDSGAASEKDKPSGIVEEPSHDDPQGKAPSPSAALAPKLHERSGKKQRLPKEEPPMIHEGPRLKNPNIGKQKARDRQYSTGSYSQPENKGWVENAGMRPDAHPPFHNAGPPPTNQSYHFNPPQELLGPHHTLPPPMSNFGPAPPLPGAFPPVMQPFRPGPGPVHHPGGPFAAPGPLHPYAHPNQLAFPQVVQGRIPCHVGQQAPPPVPDQQFYPGNPSALPITDPPIGGGPFQLPDPRPRGGRPAKQPELYNPYGTQRPDFADIPPQHMKRRGSRNSSYNQGANRPRGQSLGSYNRGDGPIVPELGGPIPVQMRGGQTAMNPSDQVVGCGENWIGPRNDKVTDLIVFDLPPDLAEGALYDFFGNMAGVIPSSVRMKIDKHNKLIATVRFASVADARRGLSLNGKALGEKEVAVKVPARYYAPLVPGARSVSNYYPGSRTVSSSYEVPMVGPVAPSMHMAPTNYSPQDARSDLPKRQGLERTAVTGSTEMRRTKKLNKSPSKESVPARGNDAAPRKVTVFSSQGEHPEEAHDNTSPGPAKDPAGREEIEPILKEEDKAVFKDKKGNKRILRNVEVPSDKTKVGPGTSAIPAEGSQASREVRSSEHHNDAKDGSSIRRPRQRQPASEVTPSAEIQDQPSPPPAAIVKEPKGVDDKGQECVNERKSIPQDAPIAEIPAPARQVLAKTDSEGPAPDDANSEEEQRESSFHSAREAQSDSGKDDVREDTAASGDQPQADLSSPQMSTRAASVETVEKKTPKGDASAGMTQAQKEQESTPALTGIPSPPESKKGGAKQTESMFPYAKSKIQQKQEKQQKKKEKKKAKSTKAPPSASGNEKPTSRIEEQYSPHASRPVTPLGRSDPPFQGQDHFPNASPTKILEGLVVTPGEKGEAGTGGKSTRSCREPDVIQPVETHKQEGDPPNVASGCVPFSEPDAPNTTGTLARDPREATASDTQKQPTPTRSTFFKPAVPIFSLLQKKTTRAGKSASSTSSAATEPAPSYATRKINDAWESKLDRSTVAKDTLSHPAEDQLHIDTTSTASSCTLQANISPPFSPSPTAAEFHTPLQTPSALVPPSQELPKKGKSKKKSKKKKVVAVAASESGEEPVQIQSEAFSDQIQVVDTLKAQSVSPPRDLPKVPTENDGEGETSEMSINKSLESGSADHDRMHMGEGDSSSASGTTTETERKHDRCSEDIELYEHERYVASARFARHIWEERGIPVPQNPQR